MQYHQWEPLQEEAKSAKLSMLRRKVAERLVAVKTKRYVNYFQRSKHDAYQHYP
jgi:hypothetical protein